MKLIKLIGGQKVLTLMRINKYLRDQGLASRREADRLVVHRQVLVNGQPAKLGQVISQTDQVKVMGVDQKKYIYLAYHKPRGLATQAPAGEPSVVAKWREKGLFPIGRLDKESEGLLILTNDGRVTTKLIGPDSQMEKEYLVITRETLRAGLPAIFAKGMKTKALGLLRRAKAELINSHTLRLTLTEGKRHQVRVMLAELGYTVSQLKRLRIDEIKLGRLPPGATRPIIPW